MKIKSIILALLISFSYSLFKTGASANFGDVLSGAGYSTEVEVLVENGIFEGDENGNFRPEDCITRAEFSVVLCRAIGFTEVAQTEEMINAEYFTDVPKTHWAAGYINTARDNGAISGMGNNMFYPEENVTNEQIVKMLVAAWGYTREAHELGGYPNGYMEIAKRFGVTDTVMFNYGNASKRWVASMFVYGVFDKLPLSDEAEIVHPDWIIRNSEADRAEIKEPLSEYTSYVDDPISILNRITPEDAKYQSLTFEQMVQMSKLPFKIENNKLICMVSINNKGGVNFHITDGKEKGAVDIKGTFFADALEFDLSNVPVGEWEFGSTYKERAVSDTYFCKIVKEAGADQPELRGGIVRYTLLHIEPQLTTMIGDTELSNSISDDRNPVNIKAILNKENKVILELSYDKILNKDWFFSYHFVQDDMFNVFIIDRIEGKGTVLDPIYVDSLIMGKTYNVDIGISHRWGDNNNIKGQLTLSLENSIPDFQFDGLVADLKLDGYNIIDWE